MGRSKDILPHSNPDIPSDHFGLGNSSKSIYDFHDESDRDEDCFNFTIDENPSPKKPKKQGTGQLKVRYPGEIAMVGVFFFLPMNLTVTKSKKNKFPIVDMEGDVPKNGIESLLKASALTTR